MRRRSVLAALAGAAGLAVPAAQASAQPLPSTEIGGGLVTLGCAVRLENRAAGPYVLADTNHASVGFTKAVIRTPEWLDVWFDKPLRQVVTSWAQPDELMVARGITIGPSIGLDRAVLRFAIDGRPVTLDDPRLYAKNANFFLSVTGIR